MSTLYTHLKKSLLTKRILKKLICFYFHSSKTVLSCNYCPQRDFAIEATNEDLATDIHDHLVSEHPGQVQDFDQFFCYFCDRRVHDMSRHLDEYFSIHHSRLLALATCCHQKTVKSPESPESPEFPEEEEEIESECKHCGQFYFPDKRLPDWMSRASCHKCLVWSCDEGGHTGVAKKKVVLCQYCRQGKFGWTKSSKDKTISICVNCVERSKAFFKMSEVSHVQTYVTGMLSQLVSQLFHILISYGHLYECRFIKNCSI